MKTAGALPELSVVAMGGHSLLDPAVPPTVANQFAVTERALAPVANLLAEGHRLVLTHGNGPQVGFLKRRSELAREHVHEVPLDALVADTQGSLGFMIQRTLRQSLRERGVKLDVATVVTEVEVDPEDPAFQHPTKPIGSFFTETEAETLKAHNGWTMVEDAGRGWRRVVPSPRPERIVQLSTVEALLAEGTAVVACGGGGIPVTPDEGGARQGLEAVIDKDRSSQVLATALGATRLIITTGVDKVCKDFQSEHPVAYDRITISELEALAADGQFPAGSMGPKIEAAIAFLRQGGRSAIICRPEHLAEAVQGRAGTTIVRD